MGGGDSYEGVRNEDCLSRLTGGGGLVRLWSVRQNGHGTGWEGIRVRMCR